MSILFCTPCYGGQLTEAFHKSCMELKENLTQIGLKHDFLSGRNESLIHRGRMEMTATFLQTDYTHMMWIDADIEFTTDDVAKLWNLNEEIAVGVYAMKKREETWYSAWHQGKLIDVKDFEGPTEVDYAGTGFMLISRKAIEAIWQHLRDKHMRLTEAIDRIAPHLTDDEAKLFDEVVEAFAPEYNGQSMDVPALYQTPIYHGGLESEDYHFCRIAQEGGFKVIMDPSVRLKHWGAVDYPIVAA